MTDERPDSSPGDLELAARAQQGDGEAFGAIYDRYLDPLYRYIYYRVADHHEAEDLTEAVFLKAWNAISALRMEGLNLRAWLYRIAHNTVVDYHRSNKPALNLDAVGGLGDSGQNPETRYSEQEMAQRLAQAITQLKPDLQQVIACRFISELSHVETAEIMGLTDNHVRVLQFRALKQLRRLMALEGYR